MTYLKNILTSEDYEQSVSNSSVTPLGSGATFTGTGEMSGYPDVMVVCKTDNTGVLYFDFSPDGTNWDSTFPTTGFIIKSGVNEFHTAVKGPRYFRVRLVNDTGAQSYLRLYTYYGHFRQGNLSINQPIGEDSDAIIVRPTNIEVDVALGRFTDRDFINKQGKAVVSTGSLPADIWGGGGTYTGFPTGAAEEFVVVCSSASDYGSGQAVTFSYLEDSTSEEYQSATVVLTGATTNTGITGTRAHTMRFNNGSTTFNVGTITLRHITTTTNVFLVMATGTSQTNAMVYTVPAKYTAVVMSEYASIRGGNNTNVDGSLWVRTSGGSPRLRRPFTIGPNAPWSPPASYVTFGAGSDIVARVTATSGNNIDLTYIMNIKIIRTSY